MLALRHELKSRPTLKFVNQDLLVALHCVSTCTRRAFQRAGPARVACGADAARLRNSSLNRF